MPLAVDAVETIGRFVDTVFLVYLLLILIHIVLSWFRQLPYNRWLNLFRGFLYDVVDPYLRIFRRFLPMARLGGIGLDLSPIVGIIVLYVARIVVGRIIGSFE
jgi:YggT family protein